MIVPLARSLYRSTGKNYLLYLTAIAAGGAITHTLVPPTPGPLVVAGQLGVDLGKMILIGMLVAAPVDWAAMMAGRTAQVHVKAERVSEPQLPEVDPAFIRSFGVKSGQLDQFRADIRTNLERELANAQIKRDEWKVKQNDKQPTPFALNGMNSATGVDSARSVHATAMTRAPVLPMRAAR